MYSIGQNCQVRFYLFWVGGWVRGWMCEGYNGLGHFTFHVSHFCWSHIVCPFTCWSPTHLSPKCNTARFDTKRPKFYMNGSLCICGMLGLQHKKNVKIIIFTTKIINNHVLAKRKLVQNVCETLRFEFESWF